MNLRESMIEAWRQRGDRSADILRAAQKAPGFFKPEALLDEVNSVRHAIAAVRWWSA